MALQSWAPVPGKRVPKYLAVKNNEDCVQVTQGEAGDLDSACLKGPSDRLTCFGLQHRGNSLKNAGSTLGRTGLTSFGARARGEISLGKKRCQALLLLC